MFTGIVETVGTIEKLEQQDDIWILEIAVDADFSNDLKQGASVSVNGICLTFIDTPSNLLRFDVVKETYDRTNLAFLERGNLVNLERSLSFGDEIGGHLVSGHIHCVGKVVKQQCKNNSTDLLIALENIDTSYLFEKGYIAINGCSLTLGEIEGSSFYLHLIPETLNATNLSEVSEGDYLNIEFEQSTVTTVETVKKLLKSNYNL